MVDVMSVGACWLSDMNPMVHTLEKLLETASSMDYPNAANRCSVQTG
jgi:hypothetical protein